MEFKHGERVRVVSGVLAGLRGVVLYTRTNGRYVEIARLPHTGATFLVLPEDLSPEEEEG